MTRVCFFGGHGGVNTQDWALFWPKVDRKLGIVGCSLFGAWDGRAAAGRKDCIALHWIATRLQPCFFFCFFQLGLARHCSAPSSLEGVLLHQFMVEFWCPLLLGLLIPGSLGVRLFGCPGVWVRATGLFGVSVLGMPEISLLPANLVDLGIKANTQTPEVEIPESWGFCGAHSEHL